MQYKVPQNVDIEDKIVGPLTLRQFMVILVTVGIIFVLYFVFPSVIRPLFFMIAILIGAAGLAIAFTKYGDQNMETFLLSAWRTFASPRQRVWKKAPEPVQTMSSSAPAKEAPKMVKKQALEEAEDDLARLAELVDSGGYVKVQQKDRVLGDFGTKNELETGELQDPLAKTESDSPALEQTIKAVEATVPNREPLVSEVAGPTPSEDFDYPKIETHDK